MGRGLVIALLVLAATATGVLTRAGLASTSREDHLRAEIAQLLNGERAFRGEAQLPVDGDVAARAQAWAERNRSVGCEPPTNCHSPEADGEILAWGDPTSKTGALVVAWMQSTVHRDILLHPQATAFGVGFACSADGTVYGVVQFRGVRKPAPATTETPIASAATQGSGCSGPPAPLTQTAPPPTTTSTTPPPTTSAAPPRPATVTRRPAAVAPTTLPVSPAALTPTPTTSVTTTSTTFLASVVLSAESPSVTAHATVEQVAFANEPLRSPPKAEPAWIGMLVVVVFLSVLRVGLQLRDNTHAHVKERADASGL